MRRSFDIEKHQQFFSGRCESRDSECVDERVRVHVTVRAAMLIRRADAVRLPRDWKQSNAGRVQHFVFEIGTIDDRILRR